MELEPVKLVVSFWIEKHLDRSGVLVFFVTVGVPVKRLVGLVLLCLNPTLFTIGKHEIVLGGSTTGRVNAGNVIVKGQFFSVRPKPVLNFGRLFVIHLGQSPRENHGGVRWDGRD